LRRYGNSLKDKSEVGEHRTETPLKKKLALATVNLVDRRGVSNLSGIETVKTV